MDINKARKMYVQKREGKMGTQKIAATPRLNDLAAPIAEQKLKLSPSISSLASSVSASSDSNPLPITLHRELRKRSSIASALLQEAKEVEEKLAKERLEKQREERLRREEEEQLERERREQKRMEEEERLRTEQLEKGSKEEEAEPNAEDGVSPKQESDVSIRAERTVDPVRVKFEELIPTYSTDRRNSYPELQSTGTMKFRLNHSGLKFNLLKATIGGANDKPKK